MNKKNLNNDVGHDSTPNNLEKKSVALKPRVLIVLYHDMGSITCRVRGLIFAEPLVKLGWTIEFIEVKSATEEQLVKLAGTFDIVYLLKIPFLSLIKKLREQTHAKLIFDLIDALWMPHHRWNQWQDLETILCLVDAVFSDNVFAADYGRKFNRNVYVIPACTQVEKFDITRNTLPAKNEDAVVIGWVGTASTINALHVIKEPLERLFLRHQNLTLRLLVLGFSGEQSLPTFKNVRFSILPHYDEDDMIREVLQMDIGLFPPPCGLEDYVIRGPLKGLIYMSGGVPAICENAGECATIIQDGINGMLACGEDEWEHKLELLVTSKDLRNKIGQNALLSVSQRNSLSMVTSVLASAFLDVLKNTQQSAQRTYPIHVPDEAALETDELEEPAFDAARRGNLDIVNLVNSAEHLVKAKRFDLAAKLYQQWLIHTNSPLRYAAAFNLGTVYEMDLAFEKAECAYRQSLAYNPQFTQAHFGLAVQLERRGHIEEAILHWRWIIHEKKSAVDDEDLALYQLAQKHLQELQLHTEKMMGDLSADNSLQEMRGGSDEAIDTDSSEGQQALTQLPFQLKKRKILIVCSHFWPSIGGVETRMGQLSTKLLSVGYDVTVMTFAIQGRVSDDFQGVKIISVDVNLPEFSKTIRQAVASEEFDICILIQDPLGNIIWSIEGLIIPQKTKLFIQPIINEDGYASWKDNPEFSQRLTNILKSASVPLVMTKNGPDARFMRCAGIEPIYLPNATTLTESVGGFRQFYNIPDNRFLILHVANLYWVKNHIGLIDALENMPASWQLVMIGTPSGEPDLVNAVMDKLKSRPEILFIPGLLSQGIAAAMEAADVVVLASHGEGSPITILEAMSHRKPWIATPQCGACNDHISGIICNLDEFRSYLQVLSDNPAIRDSLSQISYENWSQCYSWPVVIQGWIDLIEQGRLQRSFIPEQALIDEMDRTMKLIHTILLDLRPV